MRVGVRIMRVRVCMYVRACMCMGNSVKYKTFSYMQIFLILFFKKVYFVK